MFDLDRAGAFMATHARLLDRRRFATLIDGAPAVGMLDALAAYRNDDGGFGWGLEPDLRAPGSQPAGAFEALGIIADVAPATTPMAATLCDWLAAVTLPDGGVPFSLAGADAPGSAPWWAGGDPAVPSLHITAAIAAAAHRVAAHDAAVAAHPWLAGATTWCLAQIAARDRFEQAYELMFALDLLDVLAPRRDDAARELERLARLVPASGELPVGGGSEGEALRALELAPDPDRPLRALLPAAAIARQLDELERDQQADGGWTVDFPSSSPAATIEWRGVATLRALRTLRANGRL